MFSPTKIIITVEKRFNDEIDFNGGKLYLDPTYRPEWNVIPYGKVISVPPSRPLSPMVQSEYFFHNVEVGDKLYFNYGVILDEENCIEHDGQKYWLVDYYMALATVRDGKVYPVGEHILIEPMEEEVTSSIIIPEMLKKKVLTIGKVYASLDPEITVGSTVHFQEQGMFENEIEGKKLFVMYYSNILAKTIK